MATLDQLKAKYAPALKTIEEQGVKLQNLHIQDNKLFIKGAAPSEALRRRRGLRATIRARRGWVRSRRRR